MPGTVRAVASLEAVTVRCRSGDCAGARCERVASYQFDTEFGRERAYLLLDDHIQLRQPLRWASFAPGGWYVDLVEIAVAGDVITVRDWYIDVIVPAEGPYRVVDLDEYGAAVDGGALSPAQAAIGLTRLQVFLDRHLHRPDDPARQWRDFPPAALRPLLAEP